MTTNETVILCGNDDFMSDPDNRVYVDVETLSVEDIDDEMYYGYDS